MLMIHSAKKSLLTTVMKVRKQDEIPCIVDFFIIISWYAVKFAALVYWTFSHLNPAEMVTADVTLPRFSMSTVIIIAHQKVKFVSPKCFRMTSKVFWEILLNFLSASLFGLLIASGNFSLIAPFFQQLSMLMAICQPPLSTLLSCVHRQLN